MFELHESEAILRETEQRQKYMPFFSRISVNVEGTEQFLVKCLNVNA